MKELIKCYGHVLCGSKTGMGNSFLTSWTQFCLVLIWSLYKLVGEVLHDSPSFSCGPLGKLIVHPCYNRIISEVYTNIYFGYAWSNSPVSFNRPFKKYSDPKHIACAAKALSVTAEPVTRFKAWWVFFFSRWKEDWRKKSPVTKTSWNLLIWSPKMIIKLLSCQWSADFVFFKELWRFMTVISEMR